MDEGVNYPVNVERETWSYLQQSGKVNELLGSEQPPEPELTERPLDSSSWFYFELKCWQTNELAIIKSQLGSLDEKDAPEQIDIHFGELVYEVLVPGVDDIEKLVPAAEIIEAVNQILLAAGPQVRQQALDLIDKTQTALKAHAPFWQFRALLPLLPRLATLNLSLGSPTNLNDLWSQAGRTLMRWVEDRLHKY